MSDSKPVATSGVDDPYAGMPNNAQGTEAHIARDLAADPIYRQESARSRALLEISSELPDTVRRAMVSVHAALLRWRGLAREAREAATAFYREDVKGSSIRIQCTELLQQDEYGPPDEFAPNAPRPLVRKAMSYSAADKAASDHPLYQAHKQRRLELGSQKAETERKATEALETLKCHQLYLEALTRTYEPPAQLAEQM